MPSNEERLTQAWRALLGSATWHHAITVTTRYAQALTSLAAEIEKGFVRRLARAAQGPVAWFCAYEMNVPGHPHAHILLGGTQSLSAEQCARAWKSGFSRVRVQRIEVLTDADAAIRYTVKHIGRIPDSFDLSRRWIRRS